MAKTKRSGADHFPATARLHVAHDPDQNARIMTACEQQRLVHNRTVEHLLTHRSDEPLQRKNAAGITGLYGYWTTWRTENEALGNVPSIIARGAIAATADQIAKWEATNAEHAIRIARTVADAKPIPRNVQRREPNPRQLWRRRKQEERDGRHRCRIDEKVRRIDRRTLHVPGIGEVRTKDNIPEDLDIRSCVILERTPAVRLQQKPAPEDRSFKIHVGGRRVKPPLKNPGEPVAVVGLDHGIVNNLTTADHTGKVETFQHDREQARRAQARGKKLYRRIAGCRNGSRKWKRLQKTASSVRTKLNNTREHRRRAWGNDLVHRYDTVCVEKLAARNMTRSARGTSEAPGANVKAKSGLNRSLLRVAPARMNAILLRNGARTGTRIELVPARGTSQTCNDCGHRRRENRESQARFRCRSCGHEDNADANAARNVRDRGVAAIRARMDASGEDAHHRPKGADAGRKNAGQEQSRPDVTTDPPERAPSPGAIEASARPR